MNDLRAAAQQALEALKMHVPQYLRDRGYPPITALKDALAEPVEPVAHKHEWFSTGAMKPGQMRCIHCGVWNHEIPPQRPAEPVAYSVGRTLHWHEGRGVSDAQLFAAPPQRKPLAEWQINDLMADIDPEDRDSWSFRQGVYAAEKHHGVRK